MEVKENSPIPQSPGQQECLHLLFCFCTYKRDAFCFHFSITQRANTLEYSEAYMIALAVFVNLKKKLNSAA